MADDITVVKAGIPQIDDCKILTRLKAFVVDQGSPATLEHVFRGRNGNPVNLSKWLAAHTSESGSVSTTTPAGGVLKCRIKEWLGDGVGSARNPVWDIEGEATDPAKGVVQVTLEDGVVRNAGIYEMQFGVFDAAHKLLAVDRGILSVERSLFTFDPVQAYRDLGPPTIQEVRMRMMDSAANENLLLDDVEFKDEQILMAMWEPVRLWNETPPPIRTFTTRDFPYRGAWISGVMGQLHLMAGNHYRRNVFRGAAGGTSDKDKEREYMAEGQRLWSEYTAWMLNKKISINLKLFVGNVGSQYSSMNGW